MSTAHNVGLCAIIEVDKDLLYLLVGVSVVGESDVGGWFQRGGSGAGGSAQHQSNGGRSGRAPVQRTLTPSTAGKKLSWMDTMEDMFFSATDNTRSALALILDVLSPSLLLNVVLWKYG